MESVFCQAIASHYRMEDYISRVSKRIGYRLTLLMQKTKKDLTWNMADHDRIELWGFTERDHLFALKSS